MSAMRTVWTVLLAVLLAAGFDAGPSSAETYPTKPIRIVVPTSPGGITDTLARALAQRLTESFGQQVIVENKPAGAGHLGMDFVAKAPPDGYTLLVGADASFVVNQHLYSKLSYDSVNDFVPISGLGISPQALLLHPSVPANTFSELVAYAKTKPGELKALGIGAGTRLPQYPDLPAIAESVPGFLAGSWYGLAAPKGTPQEIVDKLSAETQKAFGDPAFRDKYLAPAVTFSIASPPAQFAARMAADSAKWGKVIKAAGIKVE